MKITTECLCCIVVGLLFLCVAASAEDSEYCTPLPTNITTIIDHQGDWWNITLTSDICYDCFDNGAGYGDVECTLCSSLYPGAAFTANTTCGIGNLTVQFTDTSTHTPTGWYWEFGDGDISTNQSPIHFYNTTGIYSVNLNATNSHGSDWENKTNYITVGVNGTYCIGSLIVGGESDDGGAAYLGVAIIVGIIAFGMYRRRKRNQP